MAGDEVEDGIEDAEGGEVGQNCEHSAHHPAGGSHIGCLGVEIADEDFELRNEFSADVLAGHATHLLQRSIRFYARNLRALERHEVLSLEGFGGRFLVRHDVVFLLSEKGWDRSAHPEWRNSGEP